MAVKADGYGHGAVRVAEVAVSEGVEYLGVATLDEGVEIRENSVSAPVVLLSLPIPEELESIVSHDISCIVAGPGDIKRLAEVSRRAKKITPVHLKIDCGMGRIGCRPEEAPDLGELILSCGSLKLEGTFTHLPVSDKKDQGETLSHLQAFQKAVEHMKSRDINPGILHAANSGAIVGCSTSYFDMVRPGIILYGYYPSREQERFLQVKPVMEMESRVVFLKKVPAGTGISYGLTYHTKRETEIATVSAGYGDGYSRLLTNKAQVLIRGRQYPVVGRVCMDQFMVDLGLNSGVSLNDRVTLFGPAEGGPTAETLAEAMGTIPYEIMCGINKRVPRIYID
jgi:alanine racemase